MKFIIAFLSAFLFGIGLGISGMTDPSKVIGFLDILGDWRPALALVMGGAIFAHTISYYFIKKRPSPFLDVQFYLPTNKHIDKKLVIGSALFGIGWGLAGYCPGPAVVSFVTFDKTVLTFLAAMFLGIALFHYVFKPLFILEKK